MSDVTAATFEKADWVEELQRKVFEECTIQSKNSAEEDVNESSSTTNQQVTTADVPVSVIINNINQSFAKIPHFRFLFLRKSQRTDFLEELRKSLYRVARDESVCWSEFRKSTELWFHNLITPLRQDGNNNVRLNHSDATTEDSDKDRLSMDDQNGSDPIEEDVTSCSMNQIETIASSYSFSSSSMGLGTTDSMIESSEETDHLNDDIAGIDLKLRIRRFTEETTSLRDELYRAEETTANLQREIKATQKALEKMSDKCQRLKKENEDQREMLVEAENREELCKLELRKLEKAYNLLQKKVKQLELENDNVTNLKAKIDALKKEVSDYIKQINDQKVKYDAKIIECEYLQEKYNELQSNNCMLEESYEKNLQHHQEKLKELQNQNEELKSKMNGSGDSNWLSVTPPQLHMHNFGNANDHSTPYSNNNPKKLRHADSLYSELKASGFNIDDAKIHELKEELSFYNEEIAVITDKIDEALQEVAASRNEICVPNVQLLEMDGIQNLKHKITTLLTLVKNDAATKVPSAQKIGEDSREKPDILPETKKTSNLTYDRLFRPETQDNDLIGTVTPSMTTISTPSVCDKSTSPLPEIAASVDKSELTKTPEEEIIVPIVEALNRIIEIKGADDNEEISTVKHPVHPKQKSAFTFTKRASTDWFNCIAENYESNFSKTTKDVKQNSETNNINAKGDGLHFDLMRTKNLDDSIPEIDTTSDMKTLKSDFKVHNTSQEEVKKIDTKYVTVRPTESTYVISPLVSSTQEKSELEPSKVDDTKAENSYFSTPVPASKNAPRRKFSVYHRSFDVDTLEPPVSLETSTNEKRRSISTPGVQEDFRTKTLQSLENSLTKSSLLTTYRCANHSDSSCSPSPKKHEFLLKENEDDSLFSEEKSKIPIKINKPIVIAPTKFKLSDPPINQTVTINCETTPTLGMAQKVLQRKQTNGKLIDPSTARQSMILSSSPNLIMSNENQIKTVVPEQPKVLTLTVNEEQKQTNITNNSEEQQSSVLSSTADIGKNKESDVKQDKVQLSMILNNSENVVKEDNDNDKKIELTVTLNSCTVDSSRKTFDFSHPSSTIDILSNDNSTSCLDISDSVLIPNVERNDKTYTKKEGVNEPEKASDATYAINKGESSVVTAAGNSEQTSLLSSSSSSKGSGSGDGGANSKVDESSGKTLAVKRAMSSGEDSSAESECDARLLVKTTVINDDKKKSTTLDCSVIEIDSNGKPVIGRLKGNSCNEEKNCRSRDDQTRQDKVEALPTMNGDNKEIGNRKVSLNTSLQEVISDESPKAFPSWTDENLKESGLQIIASYPDIDSEMSENFSEDELKKKYTAFSVGLSTDRMTLSKRMILSRRHRDQAEKNFTSEVQKMQQDIKEVPRQRNSVSGRVPGLRRPSLCYETPKWEIEKLDRADSNSSIAELRDIYEQTESRRQSREENNNLIRTSMNNLTTITSEHPEEEVWSNTREDVVTELENDNETHSLELIIRPRHPLFCWLHSRYETWKLMIWSIFIAFLLGFFMNRVVSSKRDGPPLSWWSLEELLSPYIEVNERNAYPRPI